MRTAQKERCEKLLEDAHLKLSSVISDIHGVSGRDMLGAIAAGERNPKVLADKARGVMRGKIKKLEEALDCSFFTEEHAFILQMMLDGIDQITAQITVLDEKIAEMCRPYEPQIEQLDDVPGFGITTGQDLIAEIGTDMSVFPAAGHLASWARQAPRVTESGGKRKGKNATGRGNPYIGGTLGEASISVGRTQTFLGAKYRRLCTHMPKQKAQVAIMRTQLIIAHALLSGPDARYEGLLRAQGRHPPPRPQPRPRPGTPRLQGHYRGHRHRNRRAPARHRRPLAAHTAPPAGAPHRKPTAPPPAAAACPAGGCRGRRARRWPARRVAAIGGIRPARPGWQRPGGRRPAGRAAGGH
jgi:Transposase IS116/IS110/IS902 family